jgi:hypothetical protein
MANIYQYKYEQKTNILSKYTLPLPVVFLPNWLIQPKKASLPSVA